MALPKMGMKSKAASTSKAAMKVMKAKRVSKVA
eukprot:CAMPEP_0171244894 /NCGR_PEP_ID=MMETSP0790-20130122/47112_1 /TAXON_ID=2925 /ORGANISM="Alexandrium catenella, Strain OF101" /LENGTH=32 /DNA_ID= /DNA_START= /DNA_END= /DNA_ORIENTATION=